MENLASSDPELLAEWLKHQREPAFHELVARYAGLVHATARRTCGDESMASEVSQLTFITLARKAKSLTSCASLGGWLHRTAMMHGKNLIRQNQRENRKRQNLAMEPEQSPHSGDAWKEMQPVLDDALAALSDKDREALLLRFYRSLTIKEVAATLGIATDAAQKRIDRATERLRGKLASRGCQAGGSLGAVMLAGFAADTQAAVLPVSLLASKAIAVGTVSSFGLSAIIASIAAFMKSSSLIPPVVALILAGAWTGTKYQSLSATEARNTLLRDRIAEARSSKTSTPVKLTQEDGPINWQKLATEDQNGPEMQRLQRRLKSMSREEMIAALDQIASLDCSKARRTVLESVVVGSMMHLDPEWVLNRFTDRLRDHEESRSLFLPLAFELWAKKDLGKATAWLDARITAGEFDSKRLDDSMSRQPREIFDSALIDVLLGVDPIAAAHRLNDLPETQRESVLSGLCNKMTNRVLNVPLTEGNHLAFANLVRSQLPANRQVPVLAACVPYFWGTEEFPKFNAYMDIIEARPEERISCAAIFTGSHIRMLSNKQKVTLDDLNLIRSEFEGIAPQAADLMMARLLTEAVQGMNQSMNLPQATDYAVEMFDASGSDAVLANFLEIADFKEPDRKLGRELAGKISDETRRAKILKRLE